MDIKPTIVHLASGHGLLLQPLGSPPSPFSMNSVRPRVDSLCWHRVFLNPFSQQCEQKAVIVSHQLSLNVVYLTPEENINFWEIAFNRRQASSTPRPRKTLSKGDKWSERETLQNSDNRGTKTRLKSHWRISTVSSDNRMFSLFSYLTIWFTASLPGAGNQGVIKAVRSSSIRLVS